MAKDTVQRKQQQKSALLKRPGSGALVRWYDARCESLRVSRVGERCPRCGAHSLDVFVPPGDCEMGFGCCRCDWVGGRVAKFPYRRHDEAGEGKRSAAC